MVTLILIVLLITLIMSIILYKKASRYYYGDTIEMIQMLSSIGLVISLAAFIFLLIVLSKGPTIDSKIELYQTQNTDIETKIQATVASYLTHERQTYKDLKPDNAIAVVSAYPELHSNELVKKQIEVYEGNNKKIIDLKEEKLNQPVYKWWLYFGK